MRDNLLGLNGTKISVRYMEQLGVHWGSVYVYMEIQSGHLEVSVVSLVSAVEGFH